MRAGLEAPESSRAPTDTPARALASVVDNATALARAELKLAAAEAKGWLIRAGLGIGLLWIAAASLQVFVLTLAIAPVLLVDKPWISVLVMLVLSAFPTIVAGVLAARELRKLREPGNENDDRQRPEQL